MNPWRTEDPRDPMADTGGVEPLASSRGPDTARRAGDAEPTRRTDRAAPHWARFVRQPSLPADLRTELDRARRARGLSYGRTAKLAHCGKSTVGDVLTGRRAPSQDLANRLADAWRLPPDLRRRLLAAAAVSWRDRVARGEVPPWEQDAGGDRHGA